MSTLLDKAKAESGPARKQTLVTPEQIELAVAWARGEVSTGQASRAAGIKATNWLAWAAHRLAAYVAQNGGRS